LLGFSFGTEMSGIAAAQGRGKERLGGVDDENVVL
jgi:hypothetical protein